MIHSRLLVKTAADVIIQGFASYPVASASLASSLIGLPSMQHVTAFGKITAAPKMLPE